MCPPGETTQSCEFPHLSILADTIEANLHLPRKAGCAAGVGFLGAVQDHVFTFLQELGESEQQDLQEQFDDLFSDSRKWAGAFRVAKALLKEADQSQWQPPSALDWESACSTRRTDRTSRTSRINPKFLGGATATRVGDVPEQIVGEWRAGGFIMLSRNKVGVVIMAGSEMANPPLGTKDAGLLCGKSYYQIFFERILRLQRLVDLAARAEREALQVVEESLELQDDRPAEASGYAAGERTMHGLTPCEIPVYVVVQSDTLFDVQRYFRAFGYFGLLEAQVIVLPQAESPVLDATGRVRLGEKGRILTASGGDGLAFQAMVDGGGVADAKYRGIEHLFLLGVDNLLSKVADPNFLGFADALRADVAVKLGEKIEPDEELGILVQRDCSGDLQEVEGEKLAWGGDTWFGTTVPASPATNLVRVLEHSEIPAEMRRKHRQNSSQLVHHHGNLGQLVFKLSAFCSVCNRADVPYHMKTSSQPFVDWRGKGDWCTPPADQINAVHFETFVSDAFRDLQNVAGYLVDRDEEGVPPVKQGMGATSGSCLRALSRLHQKWLLRQAVLQDDPPCGERADCFCEVSPLVSYAGEGLEDLLPWDILSFPFLVRAKGEAEPRPTADGRPINSLVLGGNPGARQFWVEEQDPEPSGVSGGDGELKREAGQGRGADRRLTRSRSELHRVEIQERHRRAIRAALRCQGGDSVDQSHHDGVENKQYLAVGKSLGSARSVAVRTGAVDAVERTVTDDEELTVESARNCTDSLTLLRSNARARRGVGRHG